MISSDLIAKVKQIQIRTDRMVEESFAGAYHSAFKGRGMEFEDVREYQPGDEVRTIDWNVTARMQYPYVKSFREERELTVMLVIDISPSGLFGSSGMSKRDLIAEIGGVLALSAIKNNDRVGLLLFSDEVEKYIAPARGITHVIRVIREILGCEPKGTGSDLGGALEFFARVHKRKGICFVISDFMVPECKKQLTYMGARHDLIGIGITDPIELDIPNVGLVEMRDLETGVKRLIDTSRKSVRNQLKESGKARLEAVKKTLHSVGGSYVDVRGSDYLADLRSVFMRRSHG